MKIGELDVSKIYLGGSEISKIMLGTSQVYSGGSEPTPPAPSYDTQYLTFVAEADGLTVGLSYANSNVYQYSVDSGQTWSNLANNGSTSSVNSGETIMFKASGLTPSGSDGIGTLTPSAHASVQGNIMSLLYGDDFSGQTTITNQDQFRGLFYQCTHIKSAEHLILPATTLANNCYQSMFWGCTSLTTAPVLPATTLVNSCYQYMFYQCYSLNYIKCLATDKSASYCTSQWVSDVAPTGTFVKAASMGSWTTGIDGIPQGWTVQNDDEEPPHDYSQDYLTTESLDDNNTISFTMGTGMTTAITTAVTSVSVSTDDGVTWTSMENIGANASLSVTLDAGEKAIWKGEAIGYSITTGATKSTSFSSTGLYKVYGNILSLLYDDDFINQNNPTLSDFNCFTNLFYDSRDLMDASNLFMRFTLNSTTKRPIGYLFRGCTNLIAAPELGNIDFVGSPYAFRDMFHDCTSLTTAPSLTATTLSQGCYSNMFQGCTSLTTAPELPATTLADSCYRQMFYNCLSLTIAPELPATTLADNCYTQMFRGCTSLNYIKCLATDISASNCTNNWVNGVAATGTFVKAALMSSDWQCGDSGIPNGWTVEDENGNPETTPCDAAGGGDNWDDQE